MALTYNYNSLLASTPILIERTVSAIPTPYSETEQGFSDVYARNIDAVYRVCFSFLKNSADAEDLSQDTFLRYLDRDVKFEADLKEKYGVEVDHYEFIGGTSYQAYVKINDQIVPYVCVDSATGNYHG